ncbi:hypothetical protein GOODEAATRI_025742, partial [Goodea atripinnis]
VFPRQVQPGKDESTTCKPVTASFCQGVGYKTTLYPSGVQGFNLQQIGQIVQTACSPHVDILMCRVAVPECGSGNESRVKPCRALCEKVKKDCESTLRAKRLSCAVKISHRLTAFRVHLPLSHKPPQEHVSQSRFPFAKILSPSCAQSTYLNVCQEDPSLPAEPSVNRPDQAPLLINVPGTCQTKTAPFCRDLPYTEVFLPNGLGHKTQEETNLALNEFLPLVEIGCSAHLKPFLCSVHLPKCVSGKGLTPCRTLCEQARSGCEPVMNKFGIRWPENLKCEAFTTDSCEE